MNIPPYLCRWQSGGSWEFFCEDCDIPICCWSVKNQDIFHPRWHVFRFGLWPKAFPNLNVLFLCLWVSRLELNYTVYVSATPAYRNKKRFCNFFSISFSGHCNLSRWQQSPKLEIFCHCYNRRTTRADSEKWGLGKWHGRRSHVLSNSTTG